MIRKTDQQWISLRTKARVRRYPNRISSARAKLEGNGKPKVQS